MNVELLKKVATKLRRMRHKEHFDMDSYVGETDCGTAACIAGWACLLSGLKPEHVGFVQGCAVLGLNDSDAKRLFFATRWPARFRRSDTDIQWANDEIYNDPKVAAARIEHFIATNGEE